MPSSGLMLWMFKENGIYIFRRKGMEREVCGLNPTLPYPYML
jgi:hypothetical protein